MVICLAGNTYFTRVPKGLLWISDEGIGTGLYSSWTWLYIARSSSSQYLFVCPDLLTSRRGSHRRHQHRQACCAKLIIKARLRSIHSGWSFWRCKWTQIENRLLLRSKFVIVDSYSLYLMVYVHINDNISVPTPWGNISDERSGQRYTDFTVKRQWSKSSRRYDRDHHFTQ
jgi:hypothetical protein